MLSHVEINGSVFVLFQWLVTSQGKNCFLFWFEELLEEMFCLCHCILFLEKKCHGEVL